MSHLTSRGHVCGRPDGHNGQHRTVEGERRNNAYKYKMRLQHRADPWNHVAELAYNRYRYRKKVTG